MSPVTFTRRRHSRAQFSHPPSRGRPVFASKMLPAFLPSLPLSLAAPRRRRPPPRRRPRLSMSGDRTPIDATPPPPLPEGVPPYIQSGHLGWDPDEASDEWFRAMREAEADVRGKNVPGWDAADAPAVPLNRYGEVPEYPAQTVFDGVWRATSEEEESLLREGHEWDPWAVAVKADWREKERRVWTGKEREGERKGGEGRRREGGHERVERIYEWRDGEVGEEVGEMDEEEDEEEDEQTVKPPFSSLSVKVLRGTHLTDLPLDPEPLTPEELKKRQEAAVQRAAIPKRSRRALDLEPGAWRVVNLGTSSAVPTRKRNVSCTAFIAAHPLSRREERRKSLHEPEASVDDPTLFLVDAGENSTERLEQAYWSRTHGFRWVRAIFITHLHGDHIYGLPSMLQAIGTYAGFRRRRAMEAGEDGSDPVVRIYGPYGVRGFVRTSLFWSPPIGVRFSIAELLPREKDFAHLGAGWGGTIGANDEAIGVEDCDWPDLDKDTPPPHPEEVQVEDVYASDDGMWHVWDDEDGSGVQVTAAPLKHRVPCFGYVFSETDGDVKDAQASSRASRAERTRRENDIEEVSVGRASGSVAVESNSEGQVDMAKARALGVVGRQYGVLRSGRSVTVKKTGAIVTPADVAVIDGPAGGGGDLPAAEELTSRSTAAHQDDPTLLAEEEETSFEIDSGVSPARTVVLLGDTCDSSAVAKAAHGADLLLHEATFTDSLKEKAATAMHSTARMAGAFARSVEARKLVLTHFSSRYEAFALAALMSENEPKSQTSHASDDQRGDGDNSRDFEVESEDDRMIDDDLASPNLLIRQAAKGFGEGSNIVAAVDFMEHTIARPWHGEAQWRRRVAERESKN